MGTSTNKSEKSKMQIQLLCFRGNSKRPFAFTNMYVIDRIEANEIAAEIATEDGVRVQWKRLYWHK
jgi:hypothetical protein